AEHLEQRLALPDVDLVVHSVHPRADRLRPAARPVSPLFHVGLAATPRPPRWYRTRFVFAGNRGEGVVVPDLAGRDGPSGRVARRLRFAPSPGRKDSMARLAPFARSSSFALLVLVGTFSAPPAVAAGRGGPSLAQLLPKE